MYVIARSDIEDIKRALRKAVWKDANGLIIDQSKHETYYEKAAEVALSILSPHAFHEIRPSDTVPINLFDIRK